MSITKHEKRAPHGVDPFRHSITLASAVSRVWRQVYLEPNTVGLMPSQGPQPQRKHSMKGLRWLQFLNVENDYDPPIRHARNGGEQAIQILDSQQKRFTVYPDGYREETLENGRVVKHVYEFLGEFHCISGTHTPQETQPYDHILLSYTLKHSNLSLSLI